MEPWGAVEQTACRSGVWRPPQAAQRQGLRGGAETAPRPAGARAPSREQFRASVRTADRGSERTRFIGCPTIGRNHGIPNDGYRQVDENVLRPIDSAKPQDELHRMRPRLGRGDSKDPNGRAHRAGRAGSLTVGAHAFVLSAMTDAHVRKPDSHFQNASSDASTPCARCVEFAAHEQPTTCVGMAHLLLCRRVEPRVRMRPLFRLL